MRIEEIAAAVSSLAYSSANERSLPVDDHRASPVDFNDSAAVSQSARRRVQLAGRFELAPSEPSDSEVAQAPCPRCGGVHSHGDSNGSPSSNQKLSDEAQREVTELRRRDAEVRAHEQAHLAAAGQLAQGGPRYDYERGPDGKRYAVGGEVSIALRDGRTPEETIQLAQQARRAALAPAEPSAQDRKVAAAAAKRAAKARAELRRGDDAVTKD